MYIEFTKTYLTTAKGRIIKIVDFHGNRLINDKFAKEIDEKEYNKYVEKTKKALEDSQKEKALVATERLNPKETEVEKEEKQSLNPLSSMDMVELEEYCEDNGLKIEVEDGASIEDIVTLIELAEEEKNKKKLKAKPLGLDK